MAVYHQQTLLAAHHSLQMIPLRTSCLLTKHRHALVGEGVDEGPVLGRLDEGHEAGAVLEQGHLGLGARGPDLEDQIPAKGLLCRANPRARSLVVGVLRGKW